MSDDSAPSFAKDIRPMFTDMDVEHMKPFDIDLSNKADVEAHADAIYSTVSQGIMPPRGSGEARWTDEMCARFDRWRKTGCSP
jgi:hypothetical protein